MSHSPAQIPLPENSPLQLEGGGGMDGSPDWGGEGRILGVGGGEHHIWWGAGGGRGTGALNAPQEPHRVGPSAKGEKA